MIVHICHGATGWPFGSHGPKTASHRKSSHQGHSPFLRAHVPILSAVQGHTVMVIIVPGSLACTRKGQSWPPLASSGQKQRSRESPLHILIQHFHYWRRKVVAFAMWISYPTSLQILVLISWLVQMASRTYYRNNGSVSEERWRYRLLCLWTEGSSSYFSS